MLQNCVPIFILFFFPSCPAEPREPGRGFHTDSSRDAGAGQHALLCQAPSGCLHQGQSAIGGHRGPSLCAPPKNKYILTLLIPVRQIVLENSSREDKHECPFGRSSIELTKMLCEILKVGELRKSHIDAHTHRVSLHNKLKLDSNSRWSLFFPTCWHYYYLLICLFLYPFSICRGRSRLSICCAGAAQLSLGNS